jgi:transposase
MFRYSNDLRHKVIDFLKSGNTKAETLRVFKIAKQTLYDWIKQDSLGTLEQKAQFHHGIKSRVDTEKLLEFVSKNPDLYYREIAVEFKVSKSQIHRILQRLNITVKKKSHLQRSR